MKFQPVILSKSGLIILLAFFLCLPQAQAQRTIDVGAKAGFQFATLFGDTYTGLGFKPGLALGATFETEWQANRSILAEVYFSQEGARNGNYDFSSFSTVIYDQRIRLNYIQLPLMVKQTLNFNDKVNIQLGPQLGLRLAASENRRIKSGEPSLTDNFAGTRRFNNRIKFFYPSFTVGAGYQLDEMTEVQGRLYFSIFDNVKRNAGDSEGTYPLILQFTITRVLGELESKW
jgi:hypothetical protein